MYACIRGEPNLGTERLRGVLRNLSRGGHSTRWGLETPCKPYILMIQGKGASPHNPPPETPMELWRDLFTSKHRVDGILTDWAKS